MKTSFATIIASLTLLTNAQLIYDSGAKALKCPAATGAYCYNTELIVFCAGSVGTLSKCATGTTCSQSSANAADASCGATSKGSSTSPIDDAAGAECDCDEPAVTSSKSMAPPLPSSSSFSRFSNSSTPVAPVIPSSTPCPPESSSHYVPPQPPMSTPVGPAKVSSSSMHYGTGSSGMPRPTSKVTTLHSSWKPSLTASSVSARVTSASPAVATTNAAVGMSANAVAAFGVAGFIAALL